MMKSSVNEHTHVRLKYQRSQDLFSQTNDLLTDETTDCTVDGSPVDKSSKATFITIHNYKRIKTIGKGFLSK